MPISALYELQLQEQINQEIEIARVENQREKELVITTEFDKVPVGLRYDKNTIYKVFNRIQKTETFVNGEQAENMLKYTDTYVIRFHKRIDYV